MCVLATDLDFEENVLWTKQTKLTGLSLLSTNRICESVDGLALLNLGYLIENRHCVDHTVEGTCLLLNLSRGQTRFHRFISQMNDFLEKGEQLTVALSLEACLPLSTRWDDVIMSLPFSQEVCRALWDGSGQNTVEEQNFRHGGMSDAARTLRL